MPSKNFQKPNPIVHHHLVLKPHHKKIIIGGSSLVFIFMVTIGIFTYMMYIKQEVNYKSLDKKITDLKKETQTSVNSLSDQIIQSKTDIQNLSSNLGTINEGLDLLKASVGSDFS